MSVSSMVSELSPVSLYLKHIINPGDILILEEPEAHLHPAMQQRFTQEIAKWVNEGVRVILTTHSEWVVDELSNMVARSRQLGVADSGRNELPSIEADKVGVWLFDYLDKNKPEEGTTIREIPWSSKTGGYETGFRDVLIRQNNEWADAMNGSVHTDTDDVQ